MKLLIYFLLIFNLGFAAWHYRSLDVVENVTSEDVEASHENQLILLSEYQPRKKPSLQTLLCYSLGPFRKKSHANNAQEILQENNIETKRVQIRDSSHNGFWVTLPASGSRLAAKRQVLRLKKLKVKDYFLVVKGSHENAISLGIYSKKKLARRRVDEIIRLGFVPDMEVVPLPRNEYWLNWYKGAKEQPEYSILLEIKKQQSQVSKIERSCK